MKYLLTIMALLPLYALSQVSENFESGTSGSWQMSEPGRWEASPVEPIGGSYSLKHVFDNPDAGADQAGLETGRLDMAAGNTVWQFRVRHGYDPSSSNNWAVFLSCDAPPGSMKPGGIVNGFAVAVNFSGYDDTLRLLRINNGSATEIVNSGVNWQNSVGTDSAAIIRVVRSPAGAWSLMLMNDSEEIVVTRSGNDTWTPRGQWFGIYYKYSSTRDRLFWFDDLLIDGTWTGNTDITAKALPGDVIITEIMADPSPEVGLPSFEYVELFNRSDSLIDIGGWGLTCNTSTVRLPVFCIEPGTYLLLCSTTASDHFDSSVRVLGLKSLPVLNDVGALVVLSDNEDKMIHGVEYSDTWYGNLLKREGGWSLEMTDTGHPFSGQMNWKASVARKGGTPGAENSVSGLNPDIRPVELTNVFPADSLTLIVSFSKSVANLSETLLNYSHDGITIIRVEFIDPLQRKCILFTEFPLERRRIYSFTVPEGLRDFSGNGPAGSAFLYSLTGTACPGDLKFNEILFDPWPDEYDFIEIVNISDQTVDASRLLLQSRNPVAGSGSAAIPLSEDPRCILPGGYFTVTIDKDLLIKRFPSSDGRNIFSVRNLPSLPDDRAEVVLYNRELDIIDLMNYDRAMHFSLLSVVEGVSLEKVTPAADSGNRQNWHSASGSSGWATPGAVNSVFAATEVAGARVTLSGRRITPDSDGIDDLILITYTASWPENVLRVMVFTENGYPVRTLADNLYSGYEALFAWDGKDDSGRVVPTGIYVLWISAFDSNGNTTRRKEAVAVIR